MEINKMDKRESVSVWMICRNAWNEVTDKTLIATFRNKNWAEAFLESVNTDMELVIEENITD